jgi:hypothetical protein
MKAFRESAFYRTLPMRAFSIGARGWKNFARVGKLLEVKGVAHPYCMVSKSVSENMSDRCCDRRCFGEFGREKLWMYMMLIPRR